MKTKHLLYTLALTGVFAACSEEEFSTGNGAGSVQTNRPTLSDVTLSIDQEAETRMAYDSENGYVFEKNDTIAAILMDESKRDRGAVTDADDWNEKSWLERYKLVDYVHTNYPFVYDGATFKANANMLEGNYFLTFPYMTFNGERQAYYDITNQKQYGDDDEALKESYAKNQFFVGYAKLDAGTGVADIKATLHPVLAPIRINIKGQSLGEKYTIKKVVLQGKELVSQITLDPTNAAYVKGQNQYNLTENGKEEHFNYANYLDTYKKLGSFEEELYKNDRYGSIKKEDYVYNIPENFVGSEADGDRVLNADKSQNLKYYYSDAIRQIVKPLNDWNDAENFKGHADIEVYTKDGKPVVLTGNEEFKILMMVNPFDFRNGDGDLSISIYTDKGIIQNIDLTKVQESSKSNYKTNNALVWASPEKFNNQVTVTFEDGAVVPVPTEVTYINNTEDFYTFVEWAINAKTTANIKAVFTDDITINDKLAAKIKELQKDCVLSIASDKGATVRKNRLKIATSAANKDILEHLDVIGYQNWQDGVIVEVVDGGVLALTDKTYNMAHQLNGQTWVGRLKVEVAEGGKLLIESNDKTAVQAGYDQSGTAVANRTEVVIVNEGEIEVSASKAMGFYIKNEGKMTVNEGSELYFAPTEWYGWGHSLNTIKGTINVYGTISGTIQKNFWNQGVINNYGTVSNLMNNHKGADLGLRPGQVNIMSLTATTTVNDNRGVINYGENLNSELKNVVRLLDGATTGIISYKGEGMKVTELTKANVTDATITSGKLVADDLDENTSATIERLTIENAEIVSDDKETAAFLLANGVLKLKDGAKVTNVNFYSMNANGMGELNEAPELVYTVLADGKVITFAGTVGFYSSKPDAVNDQIQEVALSFRDADVVNNGTLSASEFKAVVGDKSNYRNDDGTTKLLNTTIPTTITWHGEAAEVLKHIQSTDETFVLNASTSLADLKDALKEKAYTSVRISGALDMSKADNKNNISVLKDMDMTISGNGVIKNVGSNVITVKSLTITKSGDIINGGVQNTVAIITKKITLKNVTSVVNTNGSLIQVDEEGVVGKGSSNVVGVSSTNWTTQTIVANNTNPMLYWKVDKQCWNERAVSGL